MAEYSGLNSLPTNRHRRTTDHSCCAELCCTHYCAPSNQSPPNPHTQQPHLLSVLSGNQGVLQRAILHPWSMEPQCDRLSFRVSVPHDVEVNEDDDEPATDEEEETDE